MDSKTYYVNWSVAGVIAIQCDKDSDAQTIVENMPREIKLGYVVREMDSFDISSVDEGEDEIPEQFDDDGYNNETGEQCDENGIYPGEED